MLRPLPRAALLLLILHVIVPDAVAQVGRVGGLVRTETGEPIKGATITAENDNFGTSVTATTDDRGRFSIIGLRSGQWQFTAEAPGFLGESGEMPVRTAGAPNPPLTFALRRSGPGASTALGNVSARSLQDQLAEADALFAKEQWDAAIATYEDILELTPALNAIRLQIAAAHRMNGAHDAAIAAYEALLETDPSHEKARVGIAMAHLERGDAATAERVLVETSALPGAGRETFFALAEVRARQGAGSDAAAWFARAAEADPSWGKPLYRLAELALERGDQAAAAKYLSEVVAVAPVSAEAELAKAALGRLNR